MAEWWQTPYKGGPMAVPAAMFPRPLYPPDANEQGKKPSGDGPDVEAYQRTVWRLGRWPGPASEFDREYTDGFAHGQGPNVTETGVAGFQRQMRIDDTGWVGRPTFNALASARVPKGPHEGEMAMDANTCNLIAQAYELYGGQPEPELEVGKTVRLQALQLATTDLGYKESPAGSNQTKYGAWYGMDGQPWCAMAVSYWFEFAGGSPSFHKGDAYSYVPYVVSDARSNRNGLAVTSSPTAGDLVCYDWAWDGTYDHVGIFEAWQPGSGSTFTALEANTSTSDDSNGGEVMRRTRRVPDQATLFVRVAEP